ncbi:hypothetical protein BCR34DRAFT_10185 [Clohesyomyces aquaticus]|uniref:Receptor L-domain domain-containing protein n=1 Tax=Clohesyomyces aquaticus TaxID=1231657 RepID=A0A1Y2A5R9_9PLEO|nr:hypothetical protein BCR34DRAFT_10185 [Clohesyomyces aquaticus]
MTRCFATFVTFTFLLIQCLIVVVNADCAPASGSFTIRTSADVATLAKCTLFTGNIVVAADGPAIIDLDGITAIDGNLDIENVANLFSLSAGSLARVQSLTLMNLPKLSNLTFAALSNFSSLQWNNLPALEFSSMLGRVNSEIQEIEIANTSLKTLSWIVWPVGTLNITRNPKLKTFDIPYASINTASSLIFTDNDALESITFPDITGIYGGLQIADNANLSSLAFPNVETIGGYVQLSGAFNNISMPAMNTVNGALNVESTGDITALCNALQAKNSLKGHYDCAANVQKNSASPTTTNGAFPSSAPTASSTTISSPTASAETNSSLSTGARVGIAIGVTALIIVLTVAVLFFYLGRRQRSKIQEITPKSETTEFDDSDGTATPKELESPYTRLELGTGNKANTHELPGYVPQEMEAGHGSSELDLSARVMGLGLGTPGTPVSPAESWRSDRPLIRHELPG